MTFAFRQIHWVIALLAVFSVGGCSKTPPRPSDIILVTLDTTRRDHLGAYGYHRPVSPHLDAFAIGADVYTRAYSSASWTVPAHASIFTGLHSSDHGAHMTPGSGMADRLRADVPTLAEQLHGRGYATGAIVGAHTMHEETGFARGFDLYDAPAGTDALSSRRADVLTSRALSWLDQQEARPVFLFVNYFDPHMPYWPSAACHERFARGVAPHGKTPGKWHRRPLDENLQLYDAEICFMDEQFGVLLEGLKERRRLRNALVIVVADHGETFDPVKGITHGTTLNEELIRVPLLVKHPGQTRGARVDEVFETRKLSQTVLAAAKALATEPAGDDDDAQELAISELWHGDPKRPNPVRRALISWPLKLVVPPGGVPGASRLYDLSASAAETTDLATKRAQERETLEALLAAWVARRDIVAGSPVELDPAMVEKLRALGYLE
jgi:arylsulfatase A-like enzyme